MELLIYVEELIAVVDKCDIDLQDLKWRRVKSTEKFYAATDLRAEKGLSARVLMHRIIVERMIGRKLRTDEYVDHIDGDSLNNTRSNLRIATRGQNRANSRPNRNNTTGFKGVRRRGTRYRAEITVDKKTTYIGTFDTPEAAHAAYVEAAKQHFGEFARGE